MVRLCGSLRCCLHRDQHGRGHDLAGHHETLPRQVLAETGLSAHQPLLMADEYERCQKWSFPKREPKPSQSELVLRISGIYSAWMGNATPFHPSKIRNCSFCCSFRMVAQP